MKPPPMELIEVIGNLNGTATAGAPAAAPTSAGRDTNSVEVELTEEALLDSFFGVVELTAGSGSGSLYR